MPKDAAHPIYLDHIALAFETAFDGVDRYRGDLGGRFLGGGLDPGFYWGQVEFENEMVVELLEPRNVERDDFLRRFLDRNGPGPHHVTFKVPDIEAALERVRTAGFEPARVNFEIESWKELFLHPKQSHGIVVQLAESSGAGEPPADELPLARSGGRASLDRIVLLVADIEAAHGLFAGVLDGKEDGEGRDGGRWIELAWRRGGRIRLWQPERAREQAWLGGRIGRVHHVAFSMRSPEAVPGARALGEGVYELRPEDNRGTRLHLRRAAR